SLGQFQRNLLTSRQRRFVLLELGVRPIVLGIFVIGDASNAVRLPHLLEELRAVPFAVEENHETSAIAISFELGYGWLSGDLVEKTRHDVALECFEKPVVDRPLNGEERLAQGVIDPIVRGPPQAQSLTGDIALGQRGQAAVVEANMPIDIQGTGQLRCGLQPIPRQEPGPFFWTVVDAQGSQLVPQTANFGNTVQPQQLAELARGLVLQLLDDLDA